MIRAKELAKRIKDAKDKDLEVTKVLIDMLEAVKQLKFDLHAKTQEEFNDIYKKLDAKWVAVYYELDKSVDINAFKKFVACRHPIRAKKLGWQQHII